MLINKLICYLTLIDEIYQKKFRKHGEHTTFPPHNNSIKPLVQNIKLQQFILFNAEVKTFNFNKQFVAFRRSSFVEAKIHILQ